MPLETETGAPASSLPGPVVEVPDTSPDPAIEQADNAAMSAKYRELMGGEDGGQPAERSSGEPARDKGGRFTKTNGPRGAVGEGVSPDAPARSEDGAASGLASQAAPLPANLPPEMAEAWNAVPEAAREKLGTWAKSLHERMSQQGRELSQFRDVAPVLNEIAAAYPDGSVKPAEAVASLFNLTKEFNARPLETLIGLAQRHNLLPHLAQRLGVQPAQAEQGAYVQQLLSKIDRLEQQVSRVTSPQTIREHVSSTLDERAQIDELNRWAQSQPFYADVESDLPYFIEKVMASNPGLGTIDVLNQAMDRAVNADPAVRDKARAAAVQAAAKPDPQRTAEAKRAASVNLKSTSTGKPRELTEDEALSKVWRKHNGMAA